VNEVSKGPSTPTAWRAARVRRPEHMHISACEAGSRVGEGELVTAPLLIIF